MIRHTRNLFWFCMGFFLMLAMAPAFATSPTKPPASPESTQSQDQDQSQDQAQVQESVSSATTGGIDTTYDSDYLAVGLAGVARAVEARDCHESFGGKSGLGIGTGGRSVINEDCQSFQQCMSLVAAYRELGATDLAIAQLAQCGGQPVPEVQTFPVETESTDACAVREQELLEACTSK